MIRTIISLEPEDKAWLENIAHDSQTSMSEVVRQAIHRYQAYRRTAKGDDLSLLLSSTSGSWKKGDALAYTRKLRDEW